MSLKVQGLRHESSEFQRHLLRVAYRRASLIATVLVLSRSSLCQTASTTAVRPPSTPRSNPTPLSGSTDAAPGAWTFQAPFGNRDGQTVSSHGQRGRRWRAPASVGSLRGAWRGWGCLSVRRVVTTVSFLHSSYVRRFRHCLGWCRVLRALPFAGHASLELTGVSRGCSLVLVWRCDMCMWRLYDGARRDVGSITGRSVVHSWVWAPRRAQCGSGGGGGVVARWCLRGGPGKGAPIASRRLRAGDAWDWSPGCFFLPAGSCASSPAMSSVPPPDVEKSSMRALS